LGQGRDDTRLALPTLRKSSFAQIINRFRAFFDKPVIQFYLETL